MSNFNETVDGHKAVIVNVEKHPATVRLQFRYSKSCESWPSCIVFETSVNESAGELYADALKLRKGDEVWAIPEENHNIHQCYHYKWWQRLKNRINY